MHSAGDCWEGECWRRPERKTAMLALFVLSSLRRELSRSSACMVKFLAFSSNMTNRSGLRQILDKQPMLLRTATIDCSYDRLGTGLSGGDKSWRCVTAQTRLVRSGKSGNLCFSLRERTTDQGDGIRCRGRQVLQYTAFGRNACGRMPKQGSLL